MPLKLRLYLKHGLAVPLVLSGILFGFPAGSYETHRYVVDDARLIIHPINMSLSLRQKHALLFELANEIKSRSQQDFADFISICLEELAAMYEEEATRPDTTVDREIGGGNAAWRAETLSLADKLYAAAASVSPEMELDVDLDDTGELLLKVEGELFILSNPVLNRPHALDERIFGRVCRMHYCNNDLVSSGKNFNKRTIIIEANWVLAEGQNPEYVTRDGLHFVFGDLEQRSRKQIGSLKLIKEIKLITESLKEASNKGVLLDWDLMTIKPFMGSYDYRIQLNHFSDSIYLHLPELHHVADWQNAVVPWIRAQVEGKPVEHYINGDEALAYVLK